MKNKKFPDLESANPNNWRGVFYINKKDKRVLVPKRPPAFGWTLNFGNPISYIIIIVFLGTMIAYALLS